VVSINVDREAPIGIYDSGVGGLTVWSALQAQLPNERVIYYGDTAHVPYGDRPASDIIRFSQQIIGFLSAQGVKFVVVACNTSSALALPQLISETKLPLLGMIEPAVRTALELTKNGRIGLLGTMGTVRSGAHESVLRALNPKARLVAQACPRLVPLIEAGHRSGAELVAVVEEYLEPLLKADVDCILLGCTHYPLITEVIREVAGPVLLIDPAVAVAAQVTERLNQMGLRNDTGFGRNKVYVSAAPERFEQVTAQLLGHQEWIRDVRLAPAYML
jgi:glutamate racemase